MKPRDLSIVTLLVGVAAFGRGARAEADALVDQLGPREIAMGDAARATATGAAAALLNPAALTLTREVVFEGSYGYRGADSMSGLSVAACDSTNAMPGCFFYNYMSGSPIDGGMAVSRRAHVGGMALARALSPRFVLGSTVKYFDFNSDVMGEADSSGVTWDAGLTAHLGPMLSAGVIGYNLWGAESAHFPRSVGAGLAARPASQLTANFDALWSLESEAKRTRLGGGLEYFLTTGRGQYGYPLRVGAVHDTGADGTYLSAGFGLTSMKMGLDVGARRQVKGGDELVLAASLRIYGPRFAAGGQ